MNPTANRMPRSYHVRCALGHSSFRRVAGSRLLARNLACSGLAMSYYVRYFAESPITFKALSAAIKSIAADYKIDGGDLMRGQDVLAEIGVDSEGSDLFVEELNARLGAVAQVGGQAAQWVTSRIQGTKSIVSVRVDPAVNWDLLGPLW